MVTQPDPQPTIGRDVHYVLPSGRHRPMKLTEVHQLGLVNGVVILDGSNDHGIGSADRLHSWVVAVPCDPTGETPGTWHWPERT